jgi:hypothetical protein
MPWHGRPARVSGQRVQLSLNDIGRMPMPWHGRPARVTVRRVQLSLNDIVSNIGRMPMPRGTRIETQLQRMIICH